MRILLIVIAAIAANALPADSIAKNKIELPEYTTEGLQRVHGTTDIAIVYAEPDASLEQYQRVYLAEPYVAFRKNWMRDQNRGRMKVGARDMERIKAEVKQVFMETFTTELEKGGYALTKERAHDVLIVKPAIIGLDVIAPDMVGGGMSDTFASTAGSMTLFMELYDSETDELLVKAIDPTSDEETDYMHRMSRVSNRAAARRMMTPWAQALRQGLDDAHASTAMKEQ
jgi:hypothetical protein